MPTMDREVHLLQLLKAEYSRHLPWLCSKSGATVTVRQSGGNTFSLVAKWDGGEHSKLFDTSSVRTLGGRGGCAAKLAEVFIAEVVAARGAGKA